jgi:hypothetical protein
MAARASVAFDSSWHGRGRRTPHERQELGCTHGNSVAHNLEEQVFTTNEIVQTLSGQFEVPFPSKEVKSPDGCIAGFLLSTFVVHDNVMAVPIVALLLNPKRTPNTIARNIFTIP